MLNFDIKWATKDHFVYCTQNGLQQKVADSILEKTRVW